MIDMASLATLRRQIAEHEERQENKLKVVRHMEEIPERPEPDTLDELRMMTDIAQVEVREAQDVIFLSERHSHKLTPDVIEAQRRLLRLREETYVRMAAVVEKWSKQ